MNFRNKKDSIKDSIILHIYLIAFGDFSSGFGGIEVNDSIVIEGIEAIHAKGGKAKVAYGGALYDMSSYIHDK